MRSYRFALTPRWVAFHVLVWLLLIPAFIGLGYWQRTLWKDRADSQGLVYAKLDAKPAALGNVDPLGHFVTQQQQWVAVTVTGHYDTAHQFAVRNRSQNENAGWYVVTPLVLDDGSAVLINQGWIATSNSDVPSTAMPTLPPVPSGTVTVTGWLQPDETTANTRITDDTAKLPTGEIALITKPDLQSRVADPLHDGSIQLTSSSPANTAAAAAQPVPGPSYDNTMYIAYMIQWWVFAIVMPITWLKLLHREAQERLAKEQAALEEDWDDDEDEDDEDWEDDDEDEDVPAVPAEPVAAGAAAGASESRQPGE
ncbi:SURF1 family protein [Actinospica robiniae]|uniref:SURF1 family cytochrome oxidase biogenesis protein n=1 Tax=Actinospica robiniae TaxID=304901 RepID=UPI0006888DA7|nr:SURF1 family protein [Actinospica robiniae]